MMADLARRQAAKRSRITEAAVEVFAERGFHSSRVSEIARRAGVADGTIYLYFKNKEDILLSIFEEKMDVMLMGLREALSNTSDLEEKIRSYARYHFRQVRENRATAEVLQVELRLSNKFLKEYRPHKLWDYLHVFRDLVLEGQQNGRFRTEVDPFIAMWSFFGGLDELAMQWVLSRRQSKNKFNLDEAADQVAEIFIRGLRRDT
jgi:TetR/AcrR family fatty acid metabolism transcriptional regulator